MDRLKPKTWIVAQLPKDELHVVLSRVKPSNPGAKALQCPVRCVLRKLKGADGTICARLAAHWHLQFLWEQRHEVVSRT